MPPVRPLPLALLAALALVACTDTPEPAGPFVDSRVDWGYAWIPGALPLDVLVVLDTSPAMDAYRPIVRRELPTLVDSLANTRSGGMPDLQLGIISADPTLDARFLTDDFLTDAPTPFQTRRRNYDGDLRAIVEATADRVSSGTTSAPLDMAMRALRRPDGFLRSHARLAVIIVAANDDASAADVGGVAQALSQLDSNPSNVFVVTIAPAGAPRLEELVEHFPQRSAATTIDGEGYRAAFDELHRLQTWILAGPKCWSRVSQAHVECTAWSIHGVVPPCTNGETRLCWRLEPDLNCEGHGDGLVATFDNTHNLTPRMFHVDMQCLSTVEDTP